MSHAIARTVVARFLSNNTGLISQVGHLASSYSFRNSTVSRSVTQFSVSRIGSVGEVASSRSSSSTGTAIGSRRICRKMGSEQKPKVVFVLGAPGAGKGTQCEKIVEHFGFAHLSAGDLLREERKREGSEFGALIEDNIRNGRIVPVEITCSLLENAINATKALLRDFECNIQGASDNFRKHTAVVGEYTAGDPGGHIHVAGPAQQQDIQESTGNDKFLIDGFPRNENNLQGWNRQMGDKVQLLFVLFFECTEEQCIARCLKRGESSGRSDDNPESLKKRFNTYINDTMPIVEHYRKQDLVKTIDAVAGPDEVFDKVRYAFADIE